MLRVVSWNIGRRMEPWHELAEMAERGEADVALLQEAGSPPRFAGKQRVGMLAPPGTCRYDEKSGESTDEV